MHRRSFYISKELQNQQLKQFLKKEFDLVLELPMISFKPIPFEKNGLQAYDAIFFSSKRAVDFYLSEVDIRREQLLCCIGSKTADALSTWGYTADFVGERSGIPNEVAHQLYDFLGGKSVVIPQSNISNKSIQKVIPEEQCKNVVVYETFTLPTKLDCKPDVLVFTSPSNVRAFLQINTIDVKSQKTIAWGASTAHYLKQSNLSPFIELAISSEECLMNELIQKFL